jgi:hypothetical protein
VTNAFLIYELARLRQQDLLNEAARNRLAHQARARAPHRPGAVATLLNRVRALVGALRGSHTRHLGRRLQLGRPSL